MYNDVSMSFDGRANNVSIVDTCRTKDITNVIKQPARLGHLELWKLSNQFIVDSELHVHNILEPILHYKVSLREYRNSFIFYVYKECNEGTCTCEHYRAQLHPFRFIFAKSF